MEIELTGEFCWLLVVVIYASLMNTFLSMQVMRARKKYGVKYPTLYASKADVKEEKMAEAA